MVSVMLWQKQQKEQLPLPAIAKQYEVIQQLFPRNSGEDREDFRGYRKLIGSFAGAGRQYYQKQPDG